MDGEPNDSGGDENCVHTNYKMNSIQDINDVPCSFHEPTICEITCTFLWSKKTDRKFVSRFSFLLKTLNML